MNHNVTIIILNWNGFIDTIECLESLYKIDYPNYNVIIVDNNSQDKSIDKIKFYAKKNNLLNLQFNYNGKLALEKNTFIQSNYFISNKSLILVINDKNYGFAEGNNIGIRFALRNLDSDYILLLNNDTIVDSKFLKELIKAAENNNNIAIVGPKIYPIVENNIDQNSAVIGMKLNLFRGGLTSSVRDKGKIEDVDLVSGACMLIKTNKLKNLGLLDNTYFFGWEDVDICTKAKNFGYRVIGVPKSKICHKIGSSYGSHFADNPNILIEGIKNQLIFLHKYASFMQKLSSIPSIFFFYLFIIFWKANNLNQIKNRILSIKSGLSSFYSYRNSNK